MGLLKNKSVLGWKLSSEKSLLLFLFFVLICPFFATQFGFVGHWLNPGRETIGALDLGGASTQITFQTSEKVENKDDVMELMLYGQTYRIYTHSYLCYGQDQFLRKLLAHFIKVQSATLHTVHDFCLYVTCN